MNDIQTSVENTTQDTTVVESVVESNAGSQSSEGTTNDVATSEAHSEQKSIEQPDESRVEKAFAARLRKAEEKLEAKYSKHQFVIERAAAENDISVEEYLDSLEEQYREKELNAIPKEFRDDVLWARKQRTNETKEQKVEREKAEKQERWLTEVKGLKELFPDIKSSADIPDEVMEWRAKDNVPLDYAYAKYALGKERTKIEQETLKKLRENEASAVPSMASTSTDTKLKIAEMDDKDFEKLMNEVRRGTRKSL